MEPDQTYRMQEGEIEDLVFDLAPLTNGRSKDPDYLQTGETISSQTITANTERGSGTLTEDGGTLADGNTSCIVEVQGGTAGDVYQLKGEFTTTDGRKPILLFRIYVD